MAALREALSSGLELCLGQRCPACGARASPRRVLCDPCFDALPRWRGRLCARCLHQGRDPAACARHVGPELWAALVWNERTAMVVHALKYRENTRVAETLAEEIHRALPAQAALDLVTEVPLHPSRERERGYNQGGLLARALSRRVGAPWVPGTLRRVRATPTQTTLDPRERARNVAGAFRVAEPCWVAGRRVLLVDDVCTTGSTLLECAAALAGARARAVAAVVSWVQG
jgi:ComF family protein